MIATFILLALLNYDIGQPRQWEAIRAALEYLGNREVVMRALDMLSKAMRDDFRRTTPEGSC